MPLNDDKSTVAAVVPTELKTKLKEIARLRRWTLSQTVGALIEENFDNWVKTLGIELKQEKTAKSRKSKPDKV